MPSKVRPINSASKTTTAKARVSNLDTMLAQTGDGAFVINEVGRILTWNDAAERLLGHAAPEVIGRLCSEILDGCDEHGNRMCRAICNSRLLLEAGGVVHPFDMRTVTKAGAPIWINVSVLRMPPITVHLFRDVSAQRRLLELLHQRLVAGSSSPASASAANSGLGAREIQVLKLLATGTSTTAIARQLFVSPTTVRNHVQAILRKLDVHSRLEAITLAMRRGWI